MADRVVLHIGTMKSGTSYLQSVLETNRAVLPDLGVTFPSGFRKQTHAVRGVLRRHGKADGRNWAKVVARARAAPTPTAVVSMEFLGFADPRQVGLFLAPLEGVEVRVVVTVRDQFRVLPAQWQTFVRNRGSKDWVTYLREIEVAPARAPGQRRPSRDFRTFHRTHDVVGAVGRWSVPGVAGIDVVAVPPPTAPRDALLQRFGAAVGLDTTGLDLAGVAENPSLGYAACDWLRRANPSLPVGLTRKSYRKLVRSVARDVLLPLRGEQDRPLLDAPGAAFARRRNADLRDLLTSGRVEVHGDLEDLPLPGDDDLAGLPAVAAPPPAAQLLRTAEAVHAYAEHRVAAAAGRVDRHAFVLPPAGAHPTGEGPDGTDGTELDALLERSVGLLQQVAPRSR